MGPTMTLTVLGLLSSAFGLAPIEVLHISLQMSLDKTSGWQAALDKALAQDGIDVNSVVTFTDGKNGTALIVLTLLAGQGEDGALDIFSRLLEREDLVSDAKRQTHHPRRLAAAHADVRRCECADSPPVRLSSLRRT